MPLYDFSCLNGHTVEARGGYEESSRPCEFCGETAYRHAAYLDQYTRTETGGRGGRLGSSKKLTEGEERYARNTDTIKKETGFKSGVGLR